METLFDRAQIYVGNVDENYVNVGQLQLELLKMNGCQPASNVLEIGSGCLVAGRPIMQYLMPDRYVGIEPNSWLIEAVKEGLPDTVALIEEKCPVFLDVTDFDASSTGRTFDFVISHLYPLSRGVLAVSPLPRFHKKSIGSSRSRVGVDPLSHR